MDVGCKSLKLVMCGLLSILLMGTFAASACAEGLGGIGMLGLPSFGGLGGGTLGCEANGLKIAAPKFYLGMMADRGGTTLDLDGAFLPSLFDNTAHKYTNQGLWLGVSQLMGLNSGLCFNASGWCLVPSTAESDETFSDGFNHMDNRWNTDTHWWFVDGVLSLNAPAGFSFLAGLRYEQYTTRFSDPERASGIGILFPWATADVISESWIPLIGAEMRSPSSLGGLVVRVIGFPALLGSLKYNETQPNITPVRRLEASGSWSKGYFVEFFSEYSKRLGFGDVGLFAKWNAFQGKSRSTVDYVDNFYVPTHEQPDLTLSRCWWTLGGSFTMNFSLPL